jgi:hypothetical protein
MILLPLFIFEILNMTGSGFQQHIIAATNEHAAWEKLSHKVNIDQMQIRAFYMLIGTR